jgi:octaprenyl-diphosphate synthase
MAQAETVPEFASAASDGGRFDASVLMSPDEVGRRLHAAYTPIAADLANAGRIFEEELQSRFAFVAQLVEHSARFRGKQLRPALVFLTARACGGVTPQHPVLAAVVEMIHTATLVHDDILDEAFVRRHAATINAEWGNEPAVLLGDYLFSHAFHLASSLETTLACRWIGQATTWVCEGELQQVHHRGELDLDEATYFSIVEGKTAALTAVACRLGAHYAGATSSISDSAATYGRHLGVAFQIADDVLDLWGDERTSGKTMGTDLEKQKLTLPLIRLLATSSKAEAREVRAWLSEPTPETRRLLRPALLNNGALDYAWSRAQGQVALAIAALERFEQGDAREHLMALAESVLRRAY